MRAIIRNADPRFKERVQVYKNFDTVDDAVNSDMFNLVEIKYDGWWCRCVIRHGQAYLFSRQNVLKDIYPAERMPDCTIIGEYLKGTNRAKSGHVGQVLMCFDMIECLVPPTHRLRWKAPFPADQHTWGYEDRRKILLALNESESWDGEWMRIAHSYSIEEAHRLWSEHVEVGDGEGLVFKASPDPYIGSTVGRVKKTFTLDYVVSGYEEGKNRHKGCRIGALWGGIYIKGQYMPRACRVGGGLSDQLRAEVYRHPNQFIGRVMEVKGWQVFPSGAMRHPNFVQWRNDKKPEDCKL